MTKKNKKNKYISPIVTVLGHVNHGKTSILDYIRKTSIAEEESGKITQHINAYEINFNDQKITFIDTPGHQAFAKMRSRGSQLANIALLIIDATDGIQPQTEEALQYLNDLKLPYIIVLNKIDRLSHPHIPSKIEDQIKKHNIDLEEWGGDVPLVKTSATEGEGIEELLETILLLHEANLDKIELKDKTWGIIIESHVSSRRGKEATCLLKEGLLKKEDCIKLNSQGIKIRQMFDWKKKPLRQVVASQPFQILGFDKSPESGEIFEKIENLQNLEETAGKQGKSLDTLKIGQIEGEDVPAINLIIKTDVFGSQEALCSVLENLSQKLEVNFLVIKQGLGKVSESDIKLAQTTDAVILGFRTKESSAVQTTADQLGIKVINCNVVYDIEKEISSLLKHDKKEPKKEFIGKLRILAIFGKRKTSDKKKKNLARMIIGGKVFEGKISKNAAVEIVRGENVVGEGKIIELEQNRQPCSKVSEDNECGLLFEGTAEVKKGDLIRSFVLK